MMKMIAKGNFNSHPRDGALGKSIKIRKSQKCNYILNLIWTIYSCIFERIRAGLKMTERFSSSCYSIYIADANDERIRHLSSTVNKKKRRHVLFSTQRIPSTTPIAQ